MIYFENDSVHFSTNPSIFGEMEFLRPCRSQLHDWCQCWPLDENAVGRQQIPEVLGRCQGLPRKDEKTWGKQKPCRSKIAEYFGRRLFSIPSFPSAGGPGRCFQCHPYIWKVVLVNILMSCISTGHRYVQLYTYSWYHIYTHHVFTFSAKKWMLLHFWIYDLFSFCKHPGVHRIGTSPNLQYWNYHFITSRARTSWWMASSSTWRFVVWGEIYACSTHATSMGESLYQTIWLNLLMEGIF